VLDVHACLVGLEGAEPPPHADALPELPQLRGIELRVELGLPDQHDLEQLRGVRLEVREQAQLLERLDGEVLGLVDDDEDPPSLRVAIEQEGVEHVEQLRPRVAEGGEPELCVDRLDQVGGAQRRIEQEGDLARGAEAREQRAAQRGLAGADLPRDRHEALALLDAVDEVAEDLAVGCGQEEVSRVGAQRERLLAKAVVHRVHRAPR
jgi:hypothetical protein